MIGSLFAFMVLQVLFDLFIIYKLFDVGKVLNNYKEYIEDLVEAINIIWRTNPFLLLGYKPKTSEKNKEE